MIRVRLESPSDIEAIRGVVASAFPTDVESRLVDLIRARGRVSVSLVAEDDDGGIVGHALFSPVTIADAPSAGVGLAPVSVVPNRQGRRIGTALIREGFEACRERGFKFAVVLGSPGYYSRFGFFKGASVGLANEYGADEEFQAVELVPNGLPAGGGMVKYAPEFQEFF